jgi:hypothetical protein
LNVASDINYTEREMKAITKFLATIAMVATATASPVMAQTLWKNAAYGMSVAEVQRAIHQAAPTSQTEPTNSIRPGQRDAPELTQGMQLGCTEKRAFK